MRLEFTKMHGLGNDFVVIDGITQPVELSRAHLRHLADRHRGVGCDQILLVAPAQTPEADFHYRIFNADGHEVEQCGNGARCVARFVRDRGLSDKDSLTVETAAGLIHPRWEADGQITVDMGVPRLAPGDIPFQADASASRYNIDLDERTVTVGVVSIGNPHAVLEVMDVAAAPVSELGPRLEHHARFPNGTNVGFMEVMDRHYIRLRVFERGVGETQACGTAACAAVVVGRLQDRLDPQVTVSLTGGELTIQWQGGDQPVWMTGPATRVFEGRIEL